MSDERTSGLRLFFEVLSAFFVIAALFTAIYSDSQVLRAIAGVILISIVSASTASLMRRVEKQ